MNNLINPWQFLGIDTTPASYKKPVDSVIEEILQNLRHLLNTRQRYVAPVDSINTKSSILAAYGLPDLSQFNPESEKQRHSLCQALQACIAQHEPRLQQIQIELPASTAEGSFELNFKISGLLLLPKPPRFVQLESMLNLNQQRFELSNEGVRL